MCLRVLVAPDSFKGTLTAAQAAEAIRRGVISVMANAQVSLIPIADGGEGTVDAMLAGAGGRRITQRVTGPLGRPVNASIALLADGRTAVVEAAAACGLELMALEERDPLRATTRGVGELMLAALETGCDRIILGVGGSGTNDGGAGMLRALGARFVDAEGREVPEYAVELERVARVDLSSWTWPQPGPEVILAADVRNPLCGPQGASMVYGPQKFPSRQHAAPEVLERLDRALAALARASADALGFDASTREGAGAAGGLGFAAMAFLGARMRPGAELVLELVGFDERLREADLVITGEGRVDEQTLFGKAVKRVCEAAERHNVPVVAVAGQVSADAGLLQQIGLAAWTSIARGPSGLQQMQDEAEILVEMAAADLMRWIVLGMSLGSKHCV
ncbi:MAG: glycerate kinase family protein [Armatimonadota bacterium]